MGVELVPLPYGRKQPHVDHLVAQLAEVPVAFAEGLELFGGAVRHFAMDAQIGRAHV